jgi:hypothetical protein
MCSKEKFVEMQCMFSMLGHSPNYHNRGISQYFNTGVRCQSSGCYPFSRTPAACSTSISVVGWVLTFVAVRSLGGFESQKVSHGETNEALLKVGATLVADGTSSKTA